MFGCCRINRCEGSPSLNPASLEFHFAVVTPIPELQEDLHVGQAVVLDEFERLKAILKVEC